MPQIQLNMKEGISTSTLFNKNLPGRLRLNLNLITKISLNPNLKSVSCSVSRKDDTRYSHCLNVKTTNLKLHQSHHAIKS